MRTNVPDTAQGRFKLDSSGSRFLGRQAIYDIDLNIYGHELLFRSGEANSFNGEDGEEATRQTIDNCLQLLPEKGQGISFVNCTRRSLVERTVTLLPPANTVLEILEDVQPDPELIAVCRELREQGYRIALDDFIPNDQNIAFLEIADFIKVDFRCTDRQARQNIYALADRRRHTLIAEKVERQEEVELARSEGCRLFQGYFLSRPTVASIRTVPGSQTISLRLFSALAKTVIDFTAVVKLVEADASICYRVLRLVNSAHFGAIQRVSSVHMALMLIGTDQLRKLLLVSILGSARGATPSALAAALERARFCEQLAPYLKRDAASLYLFGMMSVLDKILEVPMAKILESVSLDQEITEALMGRKNRIRVALDLLIAREASQWQVSADQAEALGIDDSVASDLYLHSVLYAKEIAAAHSSRPVF